MVSGIILPQAFCMAALAGYLKQLSPIGLLTFLQVIYICAQLTACAGATGFSQAAINLLIFFRNRLNAFIVGFRG
jgi:hypothetical protein